MNSSSSVYVRRHDTGKEAEVPLSSLRFGIKLASFSTLAWGQTVDAENARPGDVPYIRQALDSRMCVRVDVIPTLAQGFKYFLTVPCLEGMHPEVTP